MKKKFPFMVSRGYTPEYPWLGRQHSEPNVSDDAPSVEKRPLLLLQNPGGFFKAVFCVICVIIGLALIVYAGSNIIRSRSTQRSHTRDDAQRLEPQFAALVQGPSPDVTVSEDADKEYVIDHLVVCNGEPEGLEPNEDENYTSPDVGEVVSPGEADSFDGRRGGFDEQPREVQSGVEGMGTDADATQCDEDAVDTVRDQAEPRGMLYSAQLAGLSVPEQSGTVGIGSALQATKRMLLLMRLANLVGTQRETMLRVKISEKLRKAYDEIQSVEDATTAQGEDHEDGPISFNLLAEGAVDQIQVACGDDGLDQPSLERERLATASPHIVTFFPRLAERRPNWYVSQQDMSGEESQQAAQHITQDEPDVMLCEQLNNDNCLQSTLIAHDLADSASQVVGDVTTTPIFTNLDTNTDQEEGEAKSQEITLCPTLEWGVVAEPTTPSVTETKSRTSEHNTDVHFTDGVILTDADIVPWVAQSPDPLEAHDASRGTALDHSYEHQYRTMLEQRLPLMYHVLQMRRSRQEALQQEQRATAYLRYVDLCLLQNQQEAAAVHALQQHKKDIMHLQDYASKIQHNQDSVAQGTQSSQYTHCECHNQQPVLHHHF